MKSCKRKFSWVFVVATAAIFLGFAVKSVQAGDPIPGVDVSLEQVPGSVKSTVKTGKDGRFNFGKLKPGKYVLRIVPPMAKRMKTEISRSNTSRSSRSSGSDVPPTIKVESYNSSRSNLSMSIGSGGAEVHKVSIELRKDKRLRSVKYEPIPILISSKQGGSVAGQITRQSNAIKEERVN